MGRSWRDIPLPGLRETTSAYNDATSGESEDGCVRLSLDDAVDLHLHTRAYDGRWTPSDLVEAAAAKGIKVIAVSDHDMVDNVATTTDLARKRGIHCIPAVEVTTDYRGVIYHVLLYDVDADNGELRAVLGDIRGRQGESARAGLKLLSQQKIDLPSLDGIVGGRSLMPLYVIGALVMDKHARGIDNAIDIAESVGIDFRLSTPFSTVVRVAHASGGVAVLAHPGRAEMGFVPPDLEIVEAMVADGLDGIEAYHGLHSPSDAARFAEYARKRGLLISCGSDSHGAKARTKLTPWPARLCADLLRRCGLQVEQGT